MKLTINTLSLKGMHHPVNEDSYYVGDDLFIVADGMGGECNGEIASELAVETISDFFSSRNYQQADEPVIEEMMNMAIMRADSVIQDYINQHPDSSGMGTTVLLAIIVGETLHVSWCGDSHCYLYQDGLLHSVTKDHSYVQELIDRKKNNN